MSQLQARLARAVRRTSRHGRRIVASIVDLASTRYSGGVDPVEPIDPDDPAWPAGDEAVLRTITGWARGDLDQLVAIVVLIDDEPVTVGRINLADHRRGPGVVPWEAELPLPLDRAVQVRAEAVFANGLTERLDREARVEPPPPRPPPEPISPVGDIDLPIAGSVIDRPLFTVSGWSALDPIARIEVSVDGESSSARQMAHPRPDVALQIESEHAAFCGFEQLIDITGRTPGDEVAIVVTGVDSAGGRHLIGETAVTVGEIGEPVAATEDPERMATLRARTDRVTKHHRPAPSGVRLFVITHSLELGGGQLYLQELLLRLLEPRDLRSLVVSPTDGPLRQELEEQGVEVHVVGAYPTEPTANERLLRDMAFLAGEFEATAVLVNTSGAAWGVELATRLGLPALWAIHESYAPEHFILAAFGPGGAHPTASERLDEALASASAVIFEAEATRRLYCSRGDPRRFLHVDYGIALSSIDAFQATDDRAGRRAALGWSDDDVVLLCVGTLEPRKAQGSLLRAFARVVGDHPEAVLVLVGDRGNHYGEQLRSYAERLGLGDRVRIEAVTPDCYEWYAAADAFVLPSDVESLPRSALESMAFGLPAIVADVFGLSDLVDDGVTGLHIEPRDLDALERGLRRLLELSAAERVELGKRGEAHVRAHHDSRGYATVYRDLIDGFTADPTALPTTILER